jgi:hypothetical protein
MSTSNTPILFEDRLRQYGKVIAALGLGTDSVAMIVEMVNRKLPIDLILFADTGGELPRTYFYLKIFNEWLRSQGYPGITVVRRLTREGKIETLYDQLYRLGTVPSLAFGFHTCSILHKITPQDKFCNQWQPALDTWGSGQKCLKLIGYDSSEEKRANRTCTFKPSEKYDLAFPLREWGIDREGCKAIIAKAGLPQPGKSACFFCPARKKPELIELADEAPELLEKALELEKRAIASGKLRSVKGLGRSYSWNDYLKRAA